MSHGLKKYETKSKSMRLVDVITGSHLFKVANYSLQKELGVGRFVTSAIFTVGEYDWVIKYYPDGYNDRCKNILAFYLELKSEASNTKTKLCFTMLDQNGSPSLEFSKTSVPTFGTKENEYGFSNFVDRKTFEASKYLYNDYFEIMCTVTVLKQSRLESTNFEPVVVPPSNLNQQLSQLLESGNGSDVTFEVDGEYFKAHKNVLAARLPVFTAQFFGPIIEKLTNQNVKIVDIQPAVFRVFLQFIYSDLVSEFQEEDPMIMYQHLLVAADRYEVERLKLICENELSKRIEVNNFGIILTLAEQHNCSSLKASCFNFISSTRILAEVMRTDGFEHMTRSCLFILKELGEKFSNDK